MKPEKPKSKQKEILPKRLSIWLENRNYLGRELQPRSLEEFIKQRSVAHLRVNEAIVLSIPNKREQINGKPNTSVREVLETQTNILIKNRKEIEKIAQLPEPSDLKLLTEEQLIKLQRNLALDQISKSENPLSTMLQLDMQFAAQTGLLIKYLDYFGLKRPDRLNSVWGDNNHPQPKEEPLGRVNYWLRRDLGELNFEKLPVLLRPIASEIINQAYINEKSFADAPENLRSRNIRGKNHSSPDADLRHQVKNLIKRIKDVRKVLKNLPEVPTDYEIDLMKYNILVDLYNIFTIYLLKLFTINEIRETNIESDGKNLTPGQFLTTTLEHIMLHQGGLQFFEMYFS